MMKRGTANMNLPVNSPLIKINNDFELRLPRTEDAFQLARVIDDNRAYLKQWLPWLDASQNAEDSLSFIERVLSEWSVQRIFTGLIYKKNTIAGAMGFHGKVHKGMAVGYWIAKEFSGNDLCTESCRALIKWAFKYYDDLHLVELKAAKENLASRRVAEKLGFRHEGILRDREWLYDHFVSHAIYSMTRVESKKL